MHSITVSAPGKLMLLGEHAVVYDRPCLVTTVNQRLALEARLLDDCLFQLEAPDVKISNYKKSFEDIGKAKIPKGAKFVEIAVFNFMKKYKFSSGIHINTITEFSPLYGFGSSSAVTVCTIKALSELFNITLTDKELFDLAYKTVLDIQGKGSGFDIAAAIYGGTLYFFTAGKKIEPLKIKSLPLIVGYSGVKADTVTLINQIKEKAKKYPDIIDRIYDHIAELVEQAKQALLAKDWVRFGELMNMNQGYLNSLGVSTEKLEIMIYATRSAGAYGAKLSGAGGGDCMIAIAPENKKQAVRDAITKKGGQIIDTTTNCKGVIIEKYD